MYKCININGQDFPTAKGCQRQGPNTQSQPTLSQNPPVSLIPPLPRHKNLHKGLQSRICLPLSVWTYHHKTALVGSKIYPSNLPPYHLHPSIMSEKNIFCAFMDFVKNSSMLRACASKYNVHSRIINHLLDEYESNNIPIAKQEEEHLVDTNNQNQITRWYQKQLYLNHSNHRYNYWEMLTSCQIQVLAIHFMIT